MDQKGKAGSIAVIIALVVVFLIAGASFLASAYLLYSSNSLGNEIKDLKKQLEEKSKPPLFRVASFDLSHDSGEYTESYSGKGTITCDTDKPYMVLVKITLKSGGSADEKKVQQYYVTVTDGKGEFTTYDWADKGKLDKPEYETEILAFVEATMIDE